MIRALVFDFGGVLMRTADQASRRELERRLEWPAGRADEVVFGSPLWDEAQLGRVTTAEFWADTARRLGLSADEMDAFKDAFWGGDRLDEEMVTLIRQLREAGYHTGLLSNGPTGVRRLAGELRIADAFEVMVISAEEGLMKPDRAIYERALEKLGVRAEEAIFVDDSQVNVTAAQQVGLRAVRFRGVPPLRKWLRQLGVAVPDATLSALPDIRAVIFDWGGVLQDIPDDSHIAEWERRLGLEPGTLPDALWGEVWRHLSVGAITNEEYVQHVSERLGFPGAEETERFTAEFYAGEPFNPEIVDAVRALRGRYKVALLSNAWPGQDEWLLEQFGLDVCSEFDAYINSADVGLRKPDAAIFHLALDRLGVEPQQTILVDDLLRNVDAARELGMHTLQFVDPATSLADLGLLLGHPIER